MSVLLRGFVDATQDVCGFPLLSWALQQGVQGLSVCQTCRSADLVRSLHPKLQTLSTPHQSAFQVFRCPNPQHHSFPISYRETSELSKSAGIHECIAMYSSLKGSFRGSVGAVLRLTHRPLSSSFLGLHSQIYMKDFIRYPPKGTTMETIGIE